MSRSVVSDGKDLLRLITCGSVDDGKSTLIGRMLFDSGNIYEDVLDELKIDSRRHGTQGDSIDFALLVDGLAAEREQGITIDVAYRYFSTDRRAFIIADAPGHEQYTRNMATAASSADLALILVDATKGVVSQTKRHSYLVRLLGVRSVVLVVNKLDLVDYSPEVFRVIAEEYSNYAREIGLGEVEIIPISALLGDNITKQSGKTPWYSGPTLLEKLETVVIAGDQQDSDPVRMWIQSVTRPDPTFRGFAGMLSSGSLRRGDTLVAVPSMTEVVVAKVISGDHECVEAVSGESITVTLKEEIDLSRGDLLVSPTHVPAVADKFKATVIWMSSEEMLPGRPYLLKMGTKVVPVSFESPRYEININTLEHSAARTLQLNSIGVCHAFMSAGIPLEPYEVSRAIGGFIVIDRQSFDTVGVGLVEYPLRRSDNIKWQRFEVNRVQRGQLLGHKSIVVWFTGLSGAGKSTIANLLEKKLYVHSIHTYVLDGDNIRSGLNRDLGFTDVDRVENIRRVAEVARLMLDAGLVVLVSFISPFRAERDLARSLMPDGDFLEVYVNVPLAVAEARDPKGLYAKARSGDLPHFTGIDSPYEPPESPEIVLETSMLSPEDSVDKILIELEKRGVLKLH